MAKNKAFTLVETLVAIAILLIAVVEPLSIVAGSVATANLAKDQVLAYYLAQEGVELVRNIRDTNNLNGNSWVGNLTSKCDPAGGNYCQFDANINAGNPTAITQCQDNSGSPCLTFNKISGGSSGNSVDIFGYGGGGQATSFKRLINVKETVPNQEAEIIIKIAWKTGSLYGTGVTDRSFEIRETIFNW